MRRAWTLVAAVWGLSVTGWAQMAQRPVLPSKEHVRLTAPATLETAHTANSNDLYQKLRGGWPTGATFSVHELALKREQGVLTLHDGVVALSPAVNGREVEAVFAGHGTLHVEPPTAAERHQLQMVLKRDVIDQDFTTAALAFTDGTGAELHAGAGAAQQVSSELEGVAGAMQKLTRDDLKWNLEERLLEDVLTGRPGGFFFASLKGGALSKRMLFMVDPEGAMYVAPEEEVVLTSASNPASYDVALGMHSAVETAGVERGFVISAEDLTTEIASNGGIQSKAVVRVTAERDQLQLLPLNLYPTLRVSGVWGPKGEALNYIQEDKNHDAQLEVLLPQALQKGQSVDLTVTYAGKEVVTSVGDTSYFLSPGARNSWYPNVGGYLDNYAEYHMVFRIPSELQVVATGDRVTEHKEGKQMVSEWQTATPIPVAGFTLGKFKVNVSENSKVKVQVQSYANTDSSNGPLGAVSTTGMLAAATSQGDAAVQIYTQYFGEIPYSHIALTQQEDCNFGQSLPMLVYLPNCYFYDSTTKHSMGLDDPMNFPDQEYLKVVLPHEVSHQWWGQTVGFGSYRDQWMSEGFADFSASLYLLETNQSMDAYHEFWKTERTRLLTRNQANQRPVDIGPVTMGQRVSTSRSGEDVYQNLIYPKGAYILHMLELMYWTSQYQEKPFQQAMQAFVKEYTGRVATTEDFEASLEKTMPAWVDVYGSHKLDWFFNEWVYGTEVPRYSLKADFIRNGDGWDAHVTLIQSEVSDNFVMLVPLYLELDNKQVGRIMTATVKGSKTLDRTIHLGPLPGTPKRMLLNYNYDILSEEKDK